jgi:hypothetical protein
MDYVLELGFEGLAMLQESLASTAIEGNDLSEICMETLRRLVNGEPVSDRYLLGLAWMLRNLKEASDGADRLDKESGCG